MLTARGVFCEYMAHELDVSDMNKMIAQTNSLRKKNISKDDTSKIDLELNHLTRRKE